MAASATTRAVTRSRRRRFTMGRRFESAGPLTYVFLLIAVISLVNFLVVRRIRSAET